MNLVELVKSQLGGDVVNRLGSMLGTSPDQTKTAVGATVPTLLAGLGQVASTPDGARRLETMVDSADTSVLGNLSQALSNNGQSLMSSGSGMLNSLLGGNMLSGIGTAISKFTGLGSGTINALLGFLAPTVLGLLKSKKTELGLDSGGLSRLFATQRQNIAGALPAGLGSILGSVPGLGALTGLGSKANEAADWARDQAAGAYDAGRSAVRHGANAAQSAAVGAAAGAGSAARWALPAVAVLLIALLLWWGFRSRADTNATAVNTPPAPRVTPEPRDAGLASAKIPGTEQIALVREQVSDVFSSTTSAIGNITDSASAESALPKLREASSKLDSISTTLQALPADARNQITPLIESAFGKLKPLLDKAMAIPGVSDKIKPLVDQIVQKTNALIGK